MPDDIRAKSGGPWSDMSSYRIDAKIALTRMLPEHPVNISGFVVEGLPSPGLHMLQLSDLAMPSRDRSSIS
jgi:hypothetical protein